MKYKKVKVGEVQQAAPLWSIWGKGSQQAIERMNGIGKQEFFAYVPVSPEDEEKKPSLWWRVLKWPIIIVLLAKLVDIVSGL